MARSLAVVVFCLCLAVAFAADLRRLVQERAGVIPPSTRTAVDGKGAGSDLDTANSWGWGGFGGPWGFGGPYGFGPWGYGYGGFGGWGGYGGFGGFGGYGGFW